MTTKVRKDPLGPATLSLLKNNAQWVRTMALGEHMLTGEHNAREVPRVVRRISGTSVSPSSTDITAVANGTTGTYTLTLASGRFSTDFMSVQINPCGADVANKPYLAGYQVISATSIEVYLKQMSAALGDGGSNAWTAANVDFDIAIHSVQLDPGAFATDLPAASVIGDPFVPAKWDALVQNSADVQQVLAVEHGDNSGDHETRQVATYSGLWRYNGSSFSCVAGSANFGADFTITRSSTGIYQIDCSKTLTTQTHAFVCPDWARLNSGDSEALYRMHVLQDSTTQWHLYSYRYKRTNDTWDRFDGDFWLALHPGY